MFIEPVSTEIVCQISNQEQRYLLQDHFKKFYHVLADSKFMPDASFVEVKGKVQRFHTGIPIPYHNAVFGCPEEDWDLCIEKQLRYFNEVKMPFVWFLEEEVCQKFKQKLLDRGFKEDGLYQGVIGRLKEELLCKEIPKDCEMELVKDEKIMDEFNEVVCTAFGIEGAGKEAHRQFLWKASQNSVNPMYHWAARKDGRVVSTLTTFIDKDVVSFWNGATSSDYRRQGLSTALRHYALKDALVKGCRIGISYLTSEGLAFGICSRLGYQPMWRFNVYIAPVNAKLEPSMEALLSGMIL